jgi:inner membrane protein
VDIVTHGLASLAIARGFFPRAGKMATAIAVFAGCVADIDWVSQYFGPSAYLAWHRTSLHSVVAAFLFPIIVLILISVLAVLANRSGAVFISVGTLGGGETIPEDPTRRRVFVFRRVFAYFLGAPVLAALIHILMDASQSTGLALFWPFDSKRFAADWLPAIDPWILTILILTIGVPELLHLVSSEIGAKEKRPRGQTGAIVGLVMVLAYVGVRATLHSNVLAMMNARTFHGETPRRVIAFPESLSPLTWHGVAETASALNLIEVNVSASNTFDPDTSVRIFKPADSPALDAARNTAVARRFLATAQFPKAAVEKNETGYVVLLRDLGYAARGETEREVAARIELDLNDKVKSEELVWARDLPH